MIKLKLNSDDAKINAIDIAQRSRIVVTDNDITRPPEYNDEQYIKWLNFQYLETYGEMIPYHYIITASNEIFYAKEDFICTDVPLFTGYNHDILVYIENSLKKLSTVQKSRLIQLLAFICIKHAMNAELIVYFPYDVLADQSIESPKNEVKQGVMNLLGQKNSFEIIKNSFAKELKETGKGISQAQFITLDTPLTLKELSEMTGIPQNILLQQNQYLLQS